MATITIKTTTAEDARIRPAVAAYLNLDRAATMADVTGILRNTLKQIVFDQEVKAARQAAEDGVARINPT